MLADVNVIDYEHLQLGTPKVVTDLPAGGRRLVQDAVGYLATIKSGRDDLRERARHRGASRCARARRPLRQPISGAAPERRPGSTSAYGVGR